MGPMEDGFTMLVMDNVYDSHAIGLSRLSRLLVKPDMVCGMEWMAKSADAVEVHILPVAMWMVVHGATALIQRSGAASVK